MNAIAIINPKGGVGKAQLQSAGYDSTKLTANSLRHTAVTLSLG